ncbi:nitrilase-related carbon-nitrogen hydrolase [Pleurocapsa sp. PCC 7319]|uniref:nitrilase-related carbon-nitrogen hydrolase n=1 Tax=Pleurocapsa sp. PCC 7319 TaxID=118161 RepID=UPI00034C4817|nr:nitrilase-related carbon-nitrogen hydrolase [Pleurocapsa sp. PCC 7319]
MTKATESEKIAATFDGDYDKVELVKPVIRMSVVQSCIRAVDVNRLHETRQDNLNHMLELIDAANDWGGPKDLLVFHEFPLTGYSHKWNRQDVLKIAIEIPGEETEAIGKKAKEYNSYIVFGSYAKDPEWPNHVLSITTILGPDGTIIDKHWKTRNIKHVFGPGFELFTTTIYDVLDQYVEMYGWDAVIPVTRTPIGNIATSSVQREPELFRAFAIKGAEIILRTATGGFMPIDVQATSLYNSVYTAIVNNAVSPNNPGYLSDSGSGGSAIYGPRGELLREANSVHETAVTATIPIADFRRHHYPPSVHMELYRPIFEQYVNRYPPNLFTSYQPENTSDAFRYLSDKAVWNPRSQ